MMAWPPRLLLWQQLPAGQELDAAAGLAEMNWTGSERRDFWDEVWWVVGVWMVQLEQEDLVTGVFLPHTEHP